MSLISKDPVKKYSLGVFAPRNLTDIKDIEDVLLSKLDHIEQIFTNDIKFGGYAVINFCSFHGIKYTVCPTVNKSILHVNNCIISSSDFIILFDDGKSTNARNIIEQCEKSGKKYKVYNFIGLSNAQKINDCLDKLLYEIIEQEKKLEKSEPVVFADLKKIQVKMKNLINGINTLS